MIFYLSTDLGNDPDEDEIETFPAVPESYEYFIFEISKAQNVQQDALNDRISGGNGFDIPDNCLYIDPSAEALESAYELFGVESRGDGEPTLIITDTHPDDYSEENSSIRFDLGYTDSGEAIEPILHMMFRKLEQNEFRSLRWEDRKIAFEQQIPELQSVNIATGLASTIVSLL
ncbi:hypothetical protein ACOZ4N_00245 (plasmid) [Halorientalis pallida]|uniref:hypothetical protein n=1 Tax=Halorientalis pallida TaxID=2479928 RepID=UPI003C6F3D76